MSREGEPEFVYQMFDYVADGNINAPYHERLVKMARWYVRSGPEIRKYVKILPFKVICNLNEFKEYEEFVVAQGHEGVILRTPNSPYKCGRSTWKEKYLLKHKRFYDSDAKIIGIEEQLQNLNELTINELGYAKRSSSKAGKVPAGILGKFICEDCYTKVQFNCGGGRGLTRELRREIWENRSIYIGKIIKYQYQKHGTKNKPRIGQFLGFRDSDDMS
jgi:DNA ligase-1